MSVGLELLTLPGGWKKRHHPYRAEDANSSLASEDIAECFRNGAVNKIVQSVVATWNDINPYYPTKVS